jgi:hypothetical protein
MVHVNDRPCKPANVMRIAFWLDVDGVLDP